MGAGSRCPTCGNSKVTPHRNVEDAKRQWENTRKNPPKIKKGKEQGRVGFASPPPFQAAPLAKQAGRRLVHIRFALLQSEDITRASERMELHGETCEKLMWLA